MLVWDGDAGRYDGLFEYPDMATPGGSYSFERFNNERREAVYVFRHRCGGTP